MTKTTKGTELLPWKKIRVRLREMGVSVAYDKFIYLVDKHKIPYHENTLSRRGGCVNRYYDWDIIRQFFGGFLRPVNDPKITSVKK